MRHKWQQLHKRDWPTVIRVVLMPGKYIYFDSRNPAEEIWQHQIGYLLILANSVSKKNWYLVNHATGELMLDMTFNSTKKKAPTREANKLLGYRLAGINLKEK